MRPIPVLLLLAILAILATEARAADPDTDGDGLSDFQEVHKYLTDPAKADTDGDGTPDGAWDERREYAYTVRTVVRVMRPVSPDPSDDYQDVRVLEETPTWVELEVIHYPLNTVASAIHADPDWRETARSLERFTASTLTSNYDAAMAKDLRERLAADGIDVDGLDDKTLVERVSKWLVRHASEDSGAFTGYFTHFPDGEPAIHPGCEAAMRRYDEGGRSPEEQWARDLFAKSMYERGTRGSCTSSAIYLAGCLRALGIPTRIVYCIPVIDVSDPEERAMLGEIRHPKVRRIVQSALGTRGGWRGHTFNEVYVGGRWRRLNYGNLGENILGTHVFGLMTHVLTVRDWSEADAAQTIGVRQATGAYDDVFGHVNPYSTVELSELFGAHLAGETKPTPESTAPEGSDLGRLTSPTWSDAGVGADLVPPGRLPRLAVLARVEGYDGDFEALKAYQATGSGTLWLEAAGREPVPLDMAIGGFTSDGEAWVLLLVPDEDLLRPGVPYRLRPEDPAHWRIEGALPAR